MMKLTDAARLLKKSDTYFIQGVAVRDEHITAVEGVKEDPQKLTIKQLLVGEDCLLLQAFKGKGVVDPIHQHDDHESVAYLVSGKMRLVIDGKEFIAGPGDAWIHPQGVPHYSEALEDCIQIEVKSPPRKTWVSE
jgi:quercetin dioxygenase-like cupin family protein